MDSRLLERRTNTGDSAEHDFYNPLYGTRGYDHCVYDELEQQSVPNVTGVYYSTAGDDLNVKEINPCINEKDRHTAPKPRHQYDYVDAPNGIPMHHYDYVDNGWLQSTQGQQKHKYVNTDLTTPDFTKDAPAAECDNPHYEFGPECKDN